MVRTPLRTVLLAALLLVGCSRSEDPRSGSPSTDPDHALGPEESFVWDDQPISFRPPVAPWSREREQSGGLLGVRFVKLESGGQQMHVAEFRAVGERDKCSELAALADELESLTPREFATRLVRARPYASQSINEVESESFADAAESLAEARLAYQTGDLDEVRRRIESASWHLGHVRYRLDEIVEPALFDGEGWEKMARVVVGDPVETEVAGEPALAVDYDLAPFDRDHTYHGREVYVGYNNRLFVLGFQGLEESLPLFESLVASVSFEAGACNHR
ncbi:MAG TPA: hypothetical protein PLW10_20965 [Myxococcota bacterium]|nr:hypothetical protein [Myxococcota bacterium]